MNDPEIHGQVICNVLHQTRWRGLYSSPKVVIRSCLLVMRNSWLQESVGHHWWQLLNKPDCLMFYETDHQSDSESLFCAELTERGSWMVITSKTGAIINGHEVTREQFFNTLWMLGDVILQEVCGYSPLYSVRRYERQGTGSCCSCVIRLHASVNRLWIWFSARRRLDLSASVYDKVPHCYDVRASLILFNQVNPHLHRCRWH